MNGTKASGSDLKKKNVIDALDDQLEQLADELNRRKSREIPSTPTKMSTATKMSTLKPTPRLSPALTSPPKRSCLKTETSKVVEVSNHSNQRLIDDSDDPSHLLNVWLGELDSLQKGLDSSMSPRPRDILSNGASPAAAQARGRSPSSSASVTSRESTVTPVHMRRMSTPRVESPRLDSYRYSLINLEETLEHDLDAILGELCALENNFGPATTAGSAAKVTTPGAKRKVTPPSPLVLRKAPPKSVTKPLTLLPPTNDILLNDVLPSDVSAPPTPPPPPPPLSSRENIEKFFQSVSEPQYITAESVRQNKLSMLSSSKRIDVVSQPDNKRTDSPVKRTDSPDNDSAFCDNISSNSSSDSSGEKSKSLISSSAHSVVACPRMGTLQLTKGPEDSAAKVKAEKIRLAIEKIKEASIKKIFIKVFGEDGSAKSLLVDERMTVAQVCRMLADKNHQKRETSWGLVELLPDLHMERAYEDHEFLVENLLMWKADSKNTLWFIKRPEVFDLFNRPEMYLLGDASSQCGTEMDDRSRAELVEEYFSSSGVGAPEVEGQLWLKAEGKKTWKRFHFVLRSSGLYYSPKGKKTSKDLVCLATFDVNQVYYGVKWQPKFKSPSKHCFAIKHPQIQAKNPKYIRYLCADTEEELNKWVTGIRIAKYGRTLYENYRGIIEEIAHEDIDRLASARHSVGSNGQPSSSKHPNPPSMVSLADQFQKLSPLRVETVRTPDSSDNKSFDSALQMSDASDLIHLHNNNNSNSINKSNGKNGVLVLSRSSPNSNLSSRSASSGSLSEKSSSAMSSIELGFSCDSPEGGTIRKKPTILNLKSNQVNNKSDENSGKKSQLQKEVRFKESFTTIPDKKNNIQGAQGYLPSPPPELYESSEENGDGGGPLYQSLVEVLTMGRGKKKSTQQSEESSFFITKPPQRHFSQESLASNPAMLHTATLIRSDEDDIMLLPSSSSPISKKSSSSTTSPPPPQSPKELLSPQPNRPAPVLKPAVGRKPSLDKSFLLRKQLMEERSNNNNNNNINKPGPTYEDTLRKCQSLTRHHSSPTPGSTPSDLPGTPQPLSRQNSCPEAPSIPPKPVLGPHLSQPDVGKKIAHLPPTGLQTRFRPTSQQQQQLNTNFLHDLHRAISQKIDGSDPEPKFPNRLSSGEYENVGLSSSDANRSGKVHPRPPLPKRSDETHLTWKRS